MQSTECTECNCIHQVTPEFSWEMLQQQQQQQEQQYLTTDVTCVARPITTHTWFARDDLSFGMQVKVKGR